MPKPQPNIPAWDFPNLAMPMDPGAFMTMTQPVFTTMVEINGKIYANAARLNTEFLGFVARRLQEDFAVPRHLASCKSLPEAQQVWSDYWKTTLLQYQDEIAHLTKMSESCVQQTASAVQKHAGAITRGAQFAA